MGGGGEAVRPRPHIACARDARSRKVQSTARTKRTVVRSRRRGRNRVYDGDRRGENGVTAVGRRRYRIRAAVGRTGACDDRVLRRRSKAVRARPLVGYARQAGRKEAQRATRAYGAAVGSRRRRRRSVNRYRSVRRCGTAISRYRYRINARRKRSYAGNRRTLRRRSKPVRAIPRVSSAWYRSSA